MKIASVGIRTFISTMNTTSESLKARDVFGSFVLFMSCVCRAFAPVRCYIVVTCWEKAELLALVCYVFDFVTFPCGNLGQMWYLIALIPDLCRLSYFII